MIAMGLTTIFIAAMIYAAISDLLTMTIPNKISIVLAIVFPVTALTAGLPWQDILSHVGAGAVVLAAGIALFAAGVFGGGDAKLLAAAALWVGYDQLLPLITYVAVLGGGLAVIILAYRQCPDWVAATTQWSQRLHTKAGGVPYGIAIAGGALIVFTKTNLFALVMA